MRIAGADVGPGEIVPFVLPYSELACNRRESWRRPGGGCVEAFPSLIDDLPSTARAVGCISCTASLLEREGDYSAALCPFTAFSSLPSMARGNSRALNSAPTSTTREIKYIHTSRAMPTPSDP